MSTLLCSPEGQWSAAATALPFRSCSEGAVFLLRMGLLPLPDSAVGRSWGALETPQLPRALSMEGPGDRDAFPEVCVQRLGAKSARSVSSEPRFCQGPFSRSVAQGQSWEEPGPRGGQQRRCLGTQRKSKHNNVKVKGPAQAGEGGSAQLCPTPDG